MAEVNGKPDGKGSPVDDLGSLIARYESAGVDLRQLDPVQIAKALALIQRVGPNGRVFTANDVPRVVDSYLAEMMADPQGQVYLRNLLEGMVGSSQRQTPRPQMDTDVDPDDPTAKRLAQLEQILMQQHQALQRLSQDRDSFVAERQTDQKLNELYGYLEKASQAIAGAGNYRDFLRKQLHRELGSGVFADELMTPQGIQAWAKQEIDELQALREAEPPPADGAHVGLGGGGVSFSDDSQPKSLDEVVSKWESILPD